MSTVQYNTVLPNHLPTHPPIHPSASHDRDGWYCPAPGINLKKFVQGPAWPGFYLSANFKTILQTAKHFFLNYRRLGRDGS